MDRERNVAVAAVRDAARLCKRVRDEVDPGTLEKRDRSPVTVADFGSQAIVCRALLEAFPDVPVIAEEDAAALRDSELLADVAGYVGESADDVCRWIDHGNATEYSARYWTLDPIDGTKGFLRGDHYAVALALVVDGVPAVAAVACPGLDTVFAAVLGGGATAAPLAGGDFTPIRVTATTDPAAARFCESVESAHSAHGEHARIARALGITAESVRMDSQAKYGVVARGDADIYLRLPTGKGYVEKIWDHAAGLAVVREAGGRVTDVAGKPLDFTHGARLETNRGVIVTNGALHDAVLAVL
jgi:3'(2'), 5'-bisphosphate nucleotidase